MKDKFSIIIIVILTLMVVYLLATRGGSRMEGYKNERLNKAFAKGVFFTMIATNAGNMGMMRPHVRDQQMMGSADVAISNPCLTVTWAGEGGLIKKNNQAYQAAASVCGR